MTFTAFIEAFTGRRIAAAVESDLTPPPFAEVAALREHLAASNREVQRLLSLLHDRARAQHDADEEIVRLRVANLRLADRLEAHEPAARYGPTGACPRSGGGVMAKGPDHGRPGSDKPGGNRPGKDNQTNNPKGPDKTSGGGIPPRKP